MNKLSDTFLAIYTSASSIEIDGIFLRYYSNQVHESYPGLAETIIQESTENEIILNLTAQDLESLEVNMEGSEWIIAGHTIRFFDVNLVSVGE